MGAARAPAKAWTARRKLWYGNTRSEAAPRVFAGHEKEEGMVEEREIASWRFKKGVLDKKTASLCYLAANLAVGNIT